MTQPSNANDSHGQNAMMLTLTSSAIRNDLHVWSYIKDLLDQLLSGSTDYDALLPWNWAQSHPDAIRKYRVQEREDRTQRKSAKRNARRKRLQRLQRKR